MGLRIVWASKTPRGPEQSCQADPPKVHCRWAKDCRSSGSVLLCSSKFFSVVFPTLVSGLVEPQRLHRDLVQWLSYVVQPSWGTAYCLAQLKILDFYFKDLGLDLLTVHARQVAVLLGIP